MSCQSCGASAPSGFEHFTLQEMPVTSCVSKEQANKCMYTAQGMFMCNKENLKEELGVAKNYWMVEEESSKHNFGPFIRQEK